MAAAVAAMMARIHMAPAVEEEAPVDAAHAPLVVADLAPAEALVWLRSKAVFKSTTQRLFAARAAPVAPVVVLLLVRVAEWVVEVVLVQVDPVAVDMAVMVVSVVTAAVAALEPAVIRLQSCDSVVSSCNSKMSLREG